MTIKERFEKHIISKDNCWLTNLKPTDKRGYTQFRIGKHRPVSHRASYLLYKGEIPKGMLVCHSCDNPSCVNPEHLWLGTQSDNMKDCYAKGRSAAINNLPKNCKGINNGNYKHGFRTKS